MKFAELDGISDYKHTHLHIHIYICKPYPINVYHENTFSSLSVCLSPLNTDHTNDTISVFTDGIIYCCISIDVLGYL